MAAISRWDNSTSSCIICHQSGGVLFEHDHPIEGTPPHGFHAQCMQVRIRAANLAFCPFEKCKRDLDAYSFGKTSYKTDLFFKRLMNNFLSTLTAWFASDTIRIALLSFIYKKNFQLMDLQPQIFFNESEAFFLKALSLHAFIESLAAPFCTVKITEYNRHILNYIARYGVVIGNIAIVMTGILFYITGNKQDFPKFTYQQVDVINTSKMNKLFKK